MPALSLSVVQTTEQKAVIRQRADPRNETPTGYLVRWGRGIPG
jgi:hypothetical protein